MTRQNFGTSNPSRNRATVGAILALFAVATESFLASPLSAQQTQSAQPTDLVGRWAGTGLQIDWMGNPMASPRIVLEFKANGEATIGYPSLGCDGHLTKMKAANDSIQYRETLTTGTDKCLSGGIVTLRAIGDRWLYNWTLNESWLKPNALAGQPLPPQPGTAPDGDLIRNAVLTSAPISGHSGFVPRDPNVEQRIAWIESGIVPPVRIAGETPKNVTLADLMKQLHVPGVSVAVIHNGRIDWARGYGVTAIGGPAVNTDTVFQAASISKPVTALVTMRLAKDGKLDLDIDTNTYLKSWKIPRSDLLTDRFVTARRLLSHTAGIGVDGFAGYSAGQPTPTLVQILNGEKPANSPPIRIAAEPGTRWNYSGGGYVILRQLLEDVTGKPFDVLARDSVLAPAGMTHSAFAQPLSSAFAANAALPYDVNGKPIGGGAHTYPELTPDGLWTTPTDLARFALQIQDAWEGEPNQILSQATAREMLEPGEFAGWGLGVATGGSPAHRYFWHSGSNAGFKSMLFAYNEGEGAVVMTNSDAGEKLASNLLRTIAYEYGWPDFGPDELPAVALSPKDLDQLTGTFKLGRYSVLTISRDGNGLYAAMNGQSGFRIYPSSKRQWFAIDPDGFNPAPDIEISFQPGARAGISGLILRQDETDTTAPRLSPDEAKAIVNGLAVRVKSQKQIPGSEKVLRDYMEALVEGRPDYTHLGPAAFRVTRLILAYLGDQIRQLGPIKQVTFNGVSASGGDMYSVQFEYATVNVEILCASDGTIETILPALM